jgi:hypothetical protein
MQAKDMYREWATRSAVMLLRSFFFEAVLIADAIRDFPHVIEIAHARYENAQAQFANDGFQLMVGLCNGGHLLASILG